MTLFKSHQCKFFDELFWIFKEYSIFDHRYGYSFQPIKILTKPCFIAKTVLITSLDRFCVVLSFTERKSKSDQ
jgi:hypothetical protein